MKYKVTEVPAEEDAKRKLPSWTYTISGVEFETVTSFWDYLKASKVIEDYQVEKV